MQEADDQVIRQKEPEEDEYLLEGNNQIIRVLNLQIGSNRRPRFSCSAHKTNISVRKAVNRHTRLSNILKTLYKFAVGSKKSIALAKIFESHKARLLFENLTRWNSSYLMIVSFLRA